MPDYIPAESFRGFDLASADQVEGVSLFVHDREGALMLVAGTTAVFLTGRFAGEAISKPQRGSFTGSLISGLQIELDPASVLHERPALEDLALTRQWDKISLYGRVRSSGWNDRAEAVLQKGLPGVADDPVLYFAGWRAIFIVRGKPVTVFQRDKPGADAATAGTI